MVVVVQGYGAVVGKRGNCLLVKSEKEKKEICVDQVKELHLYPSCNISSDAIQFCIQKDIWIVFLNKFGEPKGDINSFSGGCAPTYKRNQLLLVHRPEGVELVKRFLSKKIENRIRQMKRILKNKRKEETVLFLSMRIKRMEESLKKIHACISTDMNEIRDSLQGFEGSAGRSYFECVSYLLPDEYQFAQRTRNSEDVYNCVLNYLYGILYAKVKNMAYKCRLDPYIGIMHVDSYNKPTFVFDFIEGQRIICEDLAFEICKNGLIHEKDMEICEAGGLRFTEEQRKLLSSLFYSKLNEQCYYKKKQVTIEKCIYLEMLDVAQKIGEVKVDALAAV